MDGNFYRQFYGFLHNPLFLAALVSWLSCQFIKTVIALCSHSIDGGKTLLETLLWRTGGMPSSHSSLVSAVTTAIAFKHGVSSDIFVFSCCFALIVVRDSMGVRRTSGQQAHALNDLGKKISKKLDVDFEPVKEMRGHKPIEVVVGLLIGHAIGVAFSVL